MGAGMSCRDIPCIVFDENSRLDKECRCKQFCGESSAADTVFEGGYCTHCGQSDTIQSMGAGFHRGNVRILPGTWNCGDRVLQFGWLDAACGGDHCRNPDEIRGQV